MTRTIYPYFNGYQPEKKTIKFSFKFKFLLFILKIFRQKDFLEYVEKRIERINKANLLELKEIKTPSGGSGMPPIRKVKTGGIQGEYGTVGGYGTVSKNSGIPHNSSENYKSMVEEALNELIIYNNSLDLKEMK